LIRTNNTFNRLDGFETINTFYYGYGVDKYYIWLGERSLEIDFAFNGSLHSLILPWSEFEAPHSLIDDLVFAINNYTT